MLFTNHSLLIDIVSLNQFSTTIHYYLSSFSDDDGIKFDCTLFQFNLMQILKLISHSSSQSPVELSFKFFYISIAFSLWKRTKCNEDAFKWLPISGICWLGLMDLVRKSKNGQTTNASSSKNAFLFWALIKERTIYKLQQKFFSQMIFDQNSLSLCEWNISPGKKKRSQKTRFSQFHLKTTAFIELTSSGDHFSLDYLAERWIKLRML